MAEIENAEKHRRQWCSSCCYESHEYNDTNDLLNIMDPFEKYEQENPEDKLDDFCKAQIVQGIEKQMLVILKIKLKKHYLD